ncbi:DUF6879 family protein [Streptomyces sp. G-5]|uniref:DUF6879 family protein n=1 Tax=Streptomyces sp. G-5 TaxID=2977231 RepID=UPI0039777076
MPRSERHLQAFLAGEPQPEDFAVNPWMTTVRNATESGKRMYRVHIVTRPLTDYLRYELGWGYHRNAGRRRVLHPRHHRAGQSPRRRP